MADAEQKQEAAQEEAVAAKDKALEEVVNVSASVPKSG